MTHTQKGNTIQNIVRMDANSSNGKSRYSTVYHSDSEKAIARSDAGLAYSAMTQLKNLTENKSICVTANTTKEPPPDNVFN